MNSQNSNKMPALFIGHGSPLLIQESNAFTPEWEKIAKTFFRPKAIIVISAHWVRDQREITANKNQKQIFDFYGFPEELYKTKYSVAGKPELAEEIVKILPNSKLAECWGLDHGAWCVLYKMYPEQDIPVIEISLQKNDSPKKLIKLGEQLKYLRDQGVLIVLSGNMVHNLRTVDFSGKARTPTWANEFEETIHDLIVAKDQQGVIDFVTKSELTSMAHPSLEHLFPVFLILGLAEQNEKINSFNRAFDLGTISMTCFSVGL
ncbi:MAG: 4,5-DOPA dioxygenase extradiol [Bdellovibrio sp.]